MIEHPPTRSHDFTDHHTKTLLDNYRGIYGVRLRHAALAVLMRVGSCTVDEIWTYIKGRHRLDQSVTKKSLADALRYECAKGRAIRIGEVSPRTRRRIEREERRIVEQLCAQRLLAAHEGEAAPLPDAIDIA
jgi:hypothetical protein